MTVKSYLVLAPLLFWCCECYCIPYVHLVRFYGPAGFVEVAPASAPSFLAERMADYRRRGLNVTIMCRCPLKSECATDVSPPT